jgi:hypothetical protein
MLDILLGRKLEPPSFKAAKGDLVLLRLDACIAQGEEYVNVISKFPVEDGFSAVDHIQQEPETITIEGVISNSPVAGVLFAGAAPVSDYNSIVGDGRDRVVTAYETLLRMSGRRLVRLPDLKGNDVSETVPSKQIMFDLSVKLRVFTDMVFENLSFNFDKMTGDALPFKATCAKIVKVSTKESTINYSVGVLSGAAGVEDQTTVTDKGQQNTSQPTEQKMSGLKAFSEAEGGIGEKMGALVTHLGVF